MENEKTINRISTTSDLETIGKLPKIKPYNGRIPACGVFCGGCPIYTREKRPCKGAELNSSRCEKCKTFHLCCLEKEITHCFQCSSFPCTKFKGFTKRWLKYGQNFIENQKLLSEMNCTPKVGQVKHYPVIERVRYCTGLFPFNRALILLLL